MNLSLLFIIIIILKAILLFLPLLVSVAILTLYERKIMASIQRRRGPNKIGISGILQAFSDGLKLLLKESIIPFRASKGLFDVATQISFGISLAGWAVLPLGINDILSDTNVGLLLLYGILSLHVYGVILAGWSSNSKYSFLGAMRSAAQLISYEISMGLIILPIIILSGSFSLIDIIESQTGGIFHWNIFPLFPLAILFFISGLAETNRTPFDMAEAEAELVSGYNTEYSAMKFALFFLGEYVSIILVSALTVVLFLGGGDPIFSIFSYSSENENIISSIIPFIWFALKTFLIVTLFVLVRSVYPRFRFDQLMSLGWKRIFPITLAFVVFYSSIFYYFLY